MTATAAVALASREVFLPYAEIGVIEKTDSPIYDDRITRPADPHRAAHMKLHGQLCAVVVATAENMARFGVFPEHPERGEKYILVDGRGRYIDGKAAGLPGLWAVVREIGSINDFNSVALAANALVDVLTDAQKITRARKLVECGFSEQEMSDILRVEPSGVRRYLRLADPVETAPAVRTAIEEGLLSGTAAGKIVEAAAGAAPDNATRAEIQEKAVEEIKAEAAAKLTDPAAGKKGSGFARQEDGTLQASASKAKEVAEAAAAKVKSAKANTPPPAPRAAKADAVTPAFLNSLLRASEPVGNLPAAHTADGAAYLAGYRAAISRMLSAAVADPTAPGALDVHRMLFTNYTPKAA